MKKSLIGPLVGMVLAPMLGSAHAEPASFPRPPQKEISVEAQPWVRNCVAEPYLVADFIYWKVQEDGLDHAQKGVGVTTNPVTSKGKVYEPDFSFEPGFRVGLGLNLAHDGWDLLLRYTWINTHVIDTASVDPALERLEPLWTHASESLFLGGLQQARSDWDLHTSVLDFEWGRNYYISRFLTLRPFFGLKGFWLNQDYLLDYTGFLDPARTTFGESKVHSGQDSWGFGIRFGTQTAWYFSHHWSVYADLALTAAWTKFDLERRDRVLIAATNTDAEVVHLDYDRYAMTPIMELGIGLRWEMWFNDDSYHALIQAGWEEQLWWGFNRLYRIDVPYAVGGNLQYQGLTMKFQFDF